MDDHGTRAGARQAVERLDAIAVVADQSFDLDAGDVIARRQQAVP